MKKLPIFLDWALCVVVTWLSATGIWAVWDNTHAEIQKNLAFTFMILAFVVLIFSTAVNTSKKYSGK